jgi:hypothetical protein
VSDLSKLRVTLTHCAICNTVHVTCPWERIPTDCRKCGYTFTNETPETPE